MSKSPDEIFNEAVEPVIPIWNEGYPPFPYNEEWFIAITKYGDRVVLKALPKEWSYDFKTADETYMIKENVVKWMQFPDSEYIKYTQPLHLIPSVKGLIDAAKRIRPSHSVNHYDCDDDPICEKSCSACAFHKVLKAFGDLG